MSLDIQKAFDTVWISGLLLKLMSVVTCNGLWKIIADFFTDFTCCVRSGNEMSDEIRITRGVHQGAPMSMMLFNIYMNDLTVHLRRRALGVSWCGIYLGCPTYADDMIMLMRNNEELQEACVVVNKFSADWRLKYNAKKSYILGRPAGDTDVVVRLEDEAVPRSAVIQHLGSKVDFLMKNNWVGLQEMVGRTKTLCYSFMGLGTRNAQMHLFTLSNLYWKVAVPSLLYGVENISILKKEEDQVTQIHAHAARLFAGVCSTSSGMNVLRLINWPSITGIIERRKMMFLIKIMKLMAKDPVKRLAIRRLSEMITNSSQCHEGPIWECYKTFVKYYLMNVLADMVYGKRVDEMALKGEVTRRIKEEEGKRWTRHVAIYPSAGIMKDMDYDGVWPWWTHARQCPEDMKAVKKMANYVVKGERLLDYTIAATGTHCCLCGEYGGDVQTLSHLLWSCAECQNEQYENDVVRNMALETITMTQRDKTLFIINGFNLGCYERQWSNVYKYYVNRIYIVLHRVGSYFN